MKGLAFFDTNILLYADDARFPEKQERAASLFAEHLEKGTAVVSLQVLQEYFVAAVQKLKLSADAQRKVGLIAQSQIVRFDAEDVIAGVELHRLHRVSFWDALLVDAARQSGAAILYSEDMQAGSKLGSVRIVNPFLKTGLS